MGWNLNDDAGFPGENPDLPAPAPLTAEEAAADAAAEALRKRLDAAVAALGALAGVVVQHNGAELTLGLPGRGARFLRVALGSAHHRALMATPQRDRAAHARALVNRHGETPSPWDY